MQPRTNDQNPAGAGELSQELIDQMLNGGSSEQDQWSDSALQTEIEAARLAAGMRTADDAPSPVATMVARSTPSAAPTAVHPVQFMPLTQEHPTNDPSHGIELLMDVALEVSVELGRSHMAIAEILALRTGSVIELDKLAGEPVDVSVNGTLIARGEVVVVDEKFGVRITEVVTKARRLASVG
jgi:flagellar motor switch protein FliN